MSNIKAAAEPAASQPDAVDENRWHVELFPVDVNGKWGFINDKGKITISTGRRGLFAEITISDTGTGIPEAIQTRVYEPFFTTKEVGKGTGQGLALAHTVVVKKHQGKIWFETKMGSGTTFFIHLPIGRVATPAEP